MAGKISELGAAGAFAAANLIEVVQAGVNKQLTGAQLQEFIEDTIAALLTDTTTIDFTYTDGTPSLIADVIGAQVPQGRLTLVSGTPVHSSDQTAKTAIYYTPYIGETIPIYDGSKYTRKVFAELTLTLDSTNHPIESLFDIFICNDGGTIKVGTGPAWNSNATVTMTIASPCVVTDTGHGLNEGDPVIFTTSGALPTGLTAGTVYYVGKSPAANTYNVSTTRANAAAGTFINTTGTQSGTHTRTCNVRTRGTGAGTTELERKNGLWTNKNSIALKNGSGAAFATIAANQATYVGTFYTTAAGQTGVALLPAPANGGTNNIIGLYNAYNRVKTVALCRDDTASWTYGTATWRSTNNNVNNRITFVDGLQESDVAVANSNLATSIAASSASIGASVNSTTTAPNRAATIVGAIQSQIDAIDNFYPKLGLVYVQGQEAANTGTNVTFNGSAASPTRYWQNLQVTVEA